MKIYLLFAVIDLVVLLLYPIVYVFYRIRKLKNTK